MIGPLPRPGSVNKVIAGKRKSDYARHADGKAKAAVTVS
jgi:hypothetical protein